MSGEEGRGRGRGGKGMGVRIAVEEEGRLKDRRAMPWGCRRWDGRGNQAISTARDVHDSDRDSDRLGCGRNAAVWVVGCCWRATAATQPRRGTGPRVCRHACAHAASETSRGRRETRPRCVYYIILDIYIHAALRSPMWLPPGQPPAQVRIVASGPVSVRVTFRPDTQASGRRAGGTSLLACASSPFGARERAGAVGNICILPGVGTLTPCVRHPPTPPK